jgi:hypothetical protein
MFSLLLIGGAVAFAFVKKVPAKALPVKALPPKPVAQSFHVDAISLHVETVSEKALAASPIRMEQPHVAVIDVPATATQVFAQSHEAVAVANPVQIELVPPQPLVEFYSPPVDVVTQSVEVAAKQALYSFVAEKVSTEVVPEVSSPAYVEPIYGVEELEPAPAVYTQELLPPPPVYANAYSAEELPPPPPVYADVYVEPTPPPPAPSVYVEPVYEDAYITPHEEYLTPPSGFTIPEEEYLTPPSGFTIPDDN